MPDVLHKEGADRTEMITGAATLIKQLANTQKVPIGTVKEPPRSVESDDELSSVAKKSGTSSASFRCIPNTSASGNDSAYEASSVVSDDIRPEDSASVVSHKPRKTSHDERPPKKAKLTGEALKREKAFALWKYKKCNSEYQYSPIHLDMSNTLEEIEDELCKVKEESNIENAVDIARAAMTATVGVMEYTSEKQKFFDIRLSGWSEKVAYEIESAKYDGVFSELYDEWRDSVQFSPAMKLMLMIGGSALQFHVANKLAGGFQTTKAHPQQLDDPQITCGKPSMDINDIISKMRMSQEKKAASMESEQYVSELSDTSSSTESAISWSSSDSITPRRQRNKESPVLPFDNPPPTRPPTSTQGSDRVSKLRSTIRQKRAAEMTAQPAAKQPEGRIMSVPVPKAVKNPSYTPRKAMAVPILAAAFNPTMPRAPATDDAGPAAVHIDEDSVEPEPQTAIADHPDVEAHGMTLCDHLVQTISNVNPADTVPEKENTQPPPTPTPTPTPVKPKRVYKRKTQPTDVAPKQKVARKGTKAEVESTIIANPEASAASAQPQERPVLPELGADSVHPQQLQDICAST